MTPENELHAQIGQVKIGREGQTLHALLGSCVGIGFLFPERGVYGLAHCLLSKSPEVPKNLGARHVDQAIYSLFELMELAAHDARKVQVIVAGGGNMTMPDATAPSRLVGSINAEFAKKKLREQRLNIVHDDLGGNNARKVVIDCTTGTFNIKHIPKLGAAQ